MNRFTLTIVSRGASAASLRAARPTTGGPLCAYETTPGSSVDPSSMASARGLPAPPSSSPRTSATREFVVPRSMPTAAVAHASFVRVWPGSRISNSAISDLRRAPFDLVEVPRVVAQPREQLRRAPQLLVGRLRLAQRPRDLVHRLLPLAANAFGEPRDRLGPALHLRLQELLPILEGLLEELLRHGRPAPSLLPGEDRKSTRLHSSH